VDALVVLIGSAALAGVIELQRATLRSSYLDMTELLRGLGDSPSTIAVLVRVVVIPGIVGFLAAITKPDNAAATGFAIAVAGNAFVVWRGLFDPPSLARANSLAYRVLILGFLALSGVCCGAVAWLSSTLFCASSGPCSLSRGLTYVIAAIIVEVIAAVLAAPLIHYLYRGRL
jgi:hypothetical protein